MTSIPSERRKTTRRKRAMSLRFKQLVRFLRSKNQQIQSKSYESHSWLGLRILDRYLLRSFLFTFLACTLAVAGLYLFIDLVNQLDEYLEFIGKYKGGMLSSLWLIFKYYMSVIPMNFLRFGAVLSLISGVFVVVFAQNNNEFTAIKAAGTSMHRVVFPIFCMAFVLDIGVFAAQEYVVPKLSRIQLLTEEVIRDRQKISTKDVSLTDKESGTKRDIMITLSGFDIEREEATHFRAMYKDSKKKDTWISVWSQATIDENTKEQLPAVKYVEGVWVFPNDSAREYLLSSTHSTAYSKSIKKFHTNLTPLHFEMEMYDVSSVKTSDVIKVHGFWSAEVQRRCAMMFMAVIVLMLGIPLVLHAQDNSAMMGIVKCLAVAGIYLVLSFLCASKATNDLPTQMMALVWAPNIVFAIIGFFLMRNMET